MYTLLAADCTCVFKAIAGCFTLEVLESLDQILFTQWSEFSPRLLVSITSLALLARGLPLEGPVEMVLELVLLLLILLLLLVATIFWAVWSYL